ncbi:MAG: hypothetical protein ACKOPM_05005, partial [Novosphingobium sp.]
VNQDIAATPQIVPRGDQMSVYANSTGTWPITLPVSGIQHGHELTIRNLSGSGIFTALAASGAGATLPATRVLASGQQITLRFDQEVSLWREVAAPPPLKASASPTIAAIPAGGLSPELAIACSGAAPGMQAQVAPTADLGPDFELCSVRVAAGSVRFRLRNNGTAAAAPPASSWNVAAAYES